MPSCWLHLWLVLSLAAAIGCSDRSSNPLGATLPQLDSLASRIDSLTSRVDSLTSRVDSLAAETAPAYDLEVSAQRTTISLPGYSLTVQHGHPFGLVSLRLRGQGEDFVQPGLSLADWEWFWFEAETQLSLKLIEPDWAPPIVEERLGLAVLHFTWPDALWPGIALGVDYRLPVTGTQFEIDYSIANHSAKSLSKPYVMLGFPGFSNQRWASRVATALEERLPLSPHTNFLDEALASGEEEYLLLRHDVNPSTDPRQALRGVVELDLGDSTYALETSFQPSPELSQVYSAHTNKTRYLTSHLYAFLKDMDPGARRTLTVHYALSRRK